MIQATARVLRNVIEIRFDGESWEARPVVGATGTISRKIAALFSTTYETYRSTEPTTVRSTVSYSAKNDEIIIQIGEAKWRTRSSMFGPLKFEYGDVPYEIHEKLTGKFAIFRGTEIIARGELGFRSCEVHEHPAELTELLADLSQG